MSGVSQVSHQEIAVRVSLSFSCSDSLVVMPSLFVGAGRAWCSWYMVCI